MILDLSHYYELHFKQNDKDRFINDKNLNGKNRNVIAFTTIEDLDLFVRTLTSFQEEIKKEIVNKDVTDWFWGSQMNYDKLEKNSKKRFFLNQNIVGGYSGMDQELEEEIELIVEDDAYEI